MASKRPLTPSKNVSNPNTTIDLTSSPPSHSSPVHKKTRTAVTFDTALPINQDDTLYDLISALPTAKKDALLYQAALQLPNLKQQIQKAASTAPIKDFSSEIERIEVCTLQGEGGMNPTEYDQPTAEEELPEVLDEVLEAAGRGTRYETRRNALFALGEMVVFINEAGSEELSDKDVKAEWVERYVVEGIGEMVERFDGEEKVRLWGEKKWEHLTELAKEVDGSLSDILRRIEE